MPQALSFISQCVGLSMRVKSWIHISLYRFNSPDDGMHVWQDSHSSLSPRNGSRDQTIRYQRRHCLALGCIQGPCGSGPTADILWSAAPLHRQLWIHASTSCLLVGEPDLCSVVVWKGNPGNSFVGKGMVNKLQTTGPFHQRKRTYQSLSYLWTGRFSYFRRLGLHRWQ